MYSYIVRFMMRIFISITGLILFACLHPLSFAANINAPQSEPRDENIARGVLRAKQTAELTAGMSGQLLEAPYKAGQYFKSGALLAKFDCALQDAELAALMEKYQSYRLKYENAAELYKYGAAGELDVALSKSEMQHVLAEANLVKTRLKYCAVHAPFSGYVITRNASAFESPQKGQILYALEKAGALELSVIVPSKWVGWLKKGHKLDFTIDETQQVIEAQVIRLSAAIDPVSQTIEVIATTKYNPSTLSGMSGYARFKSAQ